MFVDQKITPDLGEDVSEYASWSFEELKAQESVQGRGKVRYIIKSIAEKARAFQKDVVAGRYEQRHKGNS